MADTLDDIKVKLDSLLTKFNASSTRQKIHLGLLAVVAIMVIVSFFFIKSSFGKSGYDHSVVDSLESARQEILKERVQLQEQRDSLMIFIARSNYRDSLMLRTIDRQTAYIGSINNQLSNLQDAYKDLSHYTHLTGDELQKYFSDLK